MSRERGGSPGPDGAPRRRRRMFWRPFTPPTPEEQERRDGMRPRSAQDVMRGVLRSLGASPEQARLALLWRHWDTVMGEELLPLAMPLGHRGDILLLGAEDSMAAQELRMQAGEILERVNAFMESGFFSSVHVSLVRGRAVLDRIPHAAAEFSPPPRPEPCAMAEGSRLPGMRPDSPVARAYARFAAARKKGGSAG